jgi:hypothetical protein
MCFIRKVIQRWKSERNSTEKGLMAGKRAPMQMQSRTIVLVSISFAGERETFEGGKGSISSKERGPRDRHHDQSHGFGHSVLKRLSEFAETEALTKPERRPEEALISRSLVKLKKHAPVQLTELKNRIFFTERASKRLGNGAKYGFTHKWEISPEC